MRAPHSSRLNPLLALTLLLGLTAVACGGADEYPDRLSGEASDPHADIDSAEPAGSSVFGGTPQAACTDGDVTECKIILPSQGEVENCFVGVRTCVDGEWSACAEASDATAD